ncbi:MAG: TIGR04255 family protein [Magnetococcales bacterium]|nr:TIGR04255 family protein [Magnetococcales bacterium]
MSRNAPLKEMVLGVAFDPVKDFKSVHYGLFWNRIREKFPLCQDAPPLAPSGRDGSVSIHLTPVSLPRVWYINQAEDRLLQIQADRFLVNWRKNERSEVYVGYEACLGWFLEDWNLFQQWLVEEGLGEVKLQQLELSYINQVSREEMDREMRRLGDVFPVVRLSDWPVESALPVPENFACQFRIVAPDRSGEMLIKLATAVRHVDQMPLIQVSFHVTVPIVGTDPDLLKEQFDAAHHWINFAFKKMISDSARETIWERHS